MNNWIYFTTTGTWIGPESIQECSFTENVNSDTDLCPGTVCVAELEFSYRAKSVIAQGDVIEYYTVNDHGVKSKIATLICDKPEYDGVQRGLDGSIVPIYNVVAYDFVSKTEKDLSDWLRNSQGAFPMTIWEFTQKVVAQCGLELENTSLPRNGDYQVAAFYSDGLTGRDMLKWVAEASGTFARATPDGRLVFEWYGSPAYSASIGPTTGPVEPYYILRMNGYVRRGADGTVFRVGSKGIGYYADSLTYDDYECKPIDKVQIKQTSSDVGVVYPADEEGTNALVIQGNMLLSAESDAEIRPVAQALFERFKDVTYRPCAVEVSADAGIRAGTIIQVTDVRGVSFSTYVMSVTTESGKTSIESTGNAERDSTSATNRKTLKNQRGKILELETSIDGLSVKAAELSGNYAQLKLTVDGLSSTVEKNYDDLKSYADEQADKALQSAKSSITQTATQITSEVKATYTVALTGNMLKSLNFEDAKPAGNASISNGVLTVTASGKSYGYDTALSASAYSAMSGRYLRIRFLYRTTQAFTNADDKVSVIVRAYSNDVITVWNYVKSSDPFTQAPLKEWQVFDVVTDTPVCQDVGATEVFFNVYAKSTSGIVEIRDFYIGVAETAELDKELEEYKLEVSSSITQTAESIRAEVSATYAPKSYVDEKTGQALESANSAIEQTAESIRSEVKATYATTAYVDQASSDTLASAESTIEQTASQIRSDVSATYATKDFAQDCANSAASSALQSANSSITQTANSIKAEVSAIYATKDTLTGYTKTTEVRSKFAMDASSVTVSSGSITFTGNTFRVSATNFSVDANGTVRLVTADSYSRATIANGVFEIACKRNGSWRRAATMAAHDSGSTDMVCYDESNKLAVGIAYNDGVSYVGGGITTGQKYAQLQFGNGAFITSGYVNYGQSIPGQQLIFYGSGERQYGLKLGVTDGTWALAPVTARYLQLGTPQHPFDTIYCKQVVQV